MRPRDALFVGLGALAYPVGTLVARLLAKKSALYPY